MKSFSVTIWLCFKGYRRTNDHWHELINSFSINYSFNLNVFIYFNITKIFKA